MPKNFQVAKTVTVLSKMTSNKSVARSVEIVLRLLGIWPDSSYSIFFRAVWLVFIVSAQVFQYWYIVVHFSLDDLSDLVESVSTSLPYTLMIIKLLILWANRRVFSNVLTQMAGHWSDYAIDEREMNIMKCKADISHRCSYLICSVYAIAVSFYATGTIRFILPANDDDFDVESRELLLKMHFPFASYESPIFEGVCFGQYVQLMTVGTTIGTLDALIITLILHIGGQIEILNQAMLDAYSKGVESHLSEICIRSLIRKHYDIIDFAENIKKLFMYLALVQFLGNTLVICGVGFTLVTSLDNDDRFKLIIKSLFFYIAVSMEAFIFCFAGEYLSNKSKEIADTAYNSLWYRSAPRDSRVLLLFIMRAQKQLTISVGNYMELSLQSFANLLKVSASYVSVLHAMY